MSQIASTSGSAATPATGRSVKARSPAPRAATPQSPRARAYGSAAAARASTSASTASAGRLSSAAQSAEATSNGSSLAARPRLRGGAEPSNGNGASRIPATIPANSTAAATWSALRTADDVPWTAAGSSPSAESGASRGPRANRKPLSGSPQDRTSNSAASAAYTSARPRAMLPSGRIGTASVSARPSRGRTNVAPAARAASRNGQPRGKNGPAQAVQPAAAAARAQDAARRATLGTAIVLRPRVELRRLRPAARRASTRSAADGRRAGSSSSARPTAARSGFGRSGRMVESGSAPPSIARAVSSRDVCQNGCRPASASQSITPTAQTSAAAVDVFPASRSGAMYASVPGTSPTAVREIGRAHV